MDEKLPKEHLNVKIIAFDLDDTLLNDERKISRRTLDAINKAAEKGIFIVLCSGRADNGILPYIRAMNIAGSQQGRYLVAFNGASVFDLHLRTPIYTNKVDIDILKFVYKEAKKRGMPSIVYQSGTIYSWEDSEWARMDAKLCDLNFSVVPDFETRMKMECSTSTELSTADASSGSTLLMNFASILKLPVLCAQFSRARYIALGPRSEPPIPI